MNVHQSKELISHALGREIRADEQPLAARLCEIVGGHPLALELAAARIEEGLPWKTLLGDLAAEVARLEALEEADDDLRTPPTGSEAKKRRASVRASLLLSVRYLNRAGQRLFAWLGVIAEDAIITPRMAATLWSEEEEKAARHLRTLGGLGILSVKGGGYSIHDLMHDLARELLTNPEAPARAGDIPGLGLTMQGATQQLLERYRTKTSGNLWHTLPDDGYIHDHLVRHLEEAGWESELEGLLWEKSADGHCGWDQARERLGQTSGFLADVNRLWSYADRLGEAAASEGPRTKAIALLHCALILASINSLSAGITAEVLSSAVRCGILALPSALALARQHPEPSRRVDALLALAGVVRQLDRRHLLDEALSAARAIGDAESRAEALAKVAERLPPDEALAIARSIDHDALRAEALAAVAERLPAESQPDVVHEALSAALRIGDAEWRGCALVVVAMRLPAEEALAIARGIDDAKHRAWALAAIAERLPTTDKRDALREALAVARGIDDPDQRAKTLAAVAERLLGSDQPNVLREALRAARSIFDESRAWALVAVADRLPVTDQPGNKGGRNSNRSRSAQRTPRRAGVLREALSAAYSIYHYAPRGRATAAVAERLPANEALTIAREIIDDEWRCRALVAVAERLPAMDQPGVLSEALNAARSIVIYQSRPSALAAVAVRLPTADQPGVLAEALAVARHIRDDDSRGRALMEVAKRLPPEEALVVARSIYDGDIHYDDSRAEALAAVAVRLPAADQPGVLGEALAATNIIFGEYRDKALAAVAKRLPAEEARAVARDIRDPRWRAEALGKVAERLPADEGRAVKARLPAEEDPEGLAEAVGAARSVDDANRRSEAPATVAKRLPSEKALVVARGIDDAKRRAKALAAVAERLGSRQISEPLMNEWIKTARALAMRQRDKCVADFAAVLSFIQVLGGEIAIRSFGHSIAAVGAWWP